MTRCRSSAFESECGRFVAHFVRFRRWLAAWSRLRFAAPERPPMIGHFTRRTRAFAGPEGVAGARLPVGRKPARRGVD